MTELNNNNKKDFVRIAGTKDAQLENMNAVEVAAEKICPANVERTVIQYVIAVLLWAVL